MDRVWGQGSRGFSFSFFDVIFCIGGGWAALFPHLLRGGEELGCIGVSKSRSTKEQTDSLWWLQLHRSPYIIKLNSSLLDLSRLYLVRNAEISVKRFNFCRNRGKNLEFKWGRITKDNGLAQAWVHARPISHHISWIFSDVNVLKPVASIPQSDHSVKISLPVLPIHRSVTTYLKPMDRRHNHLIRKAILASSSACMPGISCRLLAPSCMALYFSEYL